MTHPLLQIGLKSTINLSMANSVDPDETARRVVSSGSILFAKVSMLVCREVTELSDDAFVLKPTTVCYVCTSNVFSGTNVKTI